MKPCLFSPSSSTGHHIRRSKLVAPYVRSIDPRQTCEVLLWSWSAIHACLIWQPQQGLWNLDYTSIWFFSSCMAMNLWASVYPSDSIHVHKKKCNSGLPWTKSCGVNLVPLWSLHPSVNLSQGCRMLMKNDGQYQILFFMHLKLRCIHEMRSGSKFKICWIRFSLVQIHETSSPLPRCHHTSGRSIYRPYGDTDRIFVQVGNLLAVRTVLMILVCNFMQLRWLLEQPSQSSMNSLPRYQELWNLVQVSCIFIVKECLSNKNCFTFFGLESSALKAITTEYFFVKPCMLSG